MKCIVEVDYKQYLLPDIKDAMKVMDILSKGVVVSRDYTEEGSVYTVEEEPKLEVRTLPSNTKFKMAEKLQDETIKKARRFFPREALGYNPSKRLDGGCR